MKTVSYFVMAVTAICLLVCCSKKQHQNELTFNLFDDIESSDISVVTQAREKIKEVIKLDVYRIAKKTVKFEITSTEKIENDNLVAINAHFITDLDLESNVIIVKRKNQSFGTRSDGCYTVSCHDCSNCGVSSDDDGNGGMSNSCWESCCSMTVDDTGCNKLQSS